MLRSLQTSSYRFPRTLKRIIVREYFLYGMFFTLTGSFWLLQAGAYGLIYIFWYKLIGTALIFLYFFLWRRKHMFVFYNLGYGKRHILGICLMADILVSAVIYLGVFLLQKPLIHLLNL